MKLKPQDFEINKETPFQNDKLGLEGCANSLTKIVAASESGLTLSINAGWGRGKTTFVKMWKQALENEGNTTIYLNAWETDFAKDPLMAIMDGILSGIDIETLDADRQQLWEAVADSIIGITKAIPGLGFFGAAGEAIKKGIDGCLTDCNDLQKHQSYKCLLEDFREKFSKAVSDITPDKPLILFVDELDRCRPNYSVEMLERMKHFFSVDNVVFVLAIDKSVMLQAIRGVYNSAELDSESYLRRFIDLEFNLPEPDVATFIGYVYDKLGLSAYESDYWNYMDKQFYGGNRDQEFIGIIALLFQYTNYSLRDIEKYFNRLAVIMKTLPKSGSSLEVSMMILFLHIFNNRLYQQIKLKELQFKELMLELEKAICQNGINVDSDKIGYYKYMIFCTALHYRQYCGYKFEEDARTNFKIEEFRFSIMPMGSNDKNIYIKACNDNPGSYLQGLFPIIELLNINI